MLRSMHPLAIDRSHSSASSHALPREYATKYVEAVCVVDPVKVLVGVAFRVADAVDSLVQVGDAVNVASPRVNVTVPVTTVPLTSVEPEGDALLDFAGNVSESLCSSDKLSVTLVVHDWVSVVLRSRDGERDVLQLIVPCSFVSLAEANVDPETVIDRGEAVSVADLDGVGVDEKLNVGESVLEAAVRLPDMECEVC